MAPPNFWSAPAASASKNWPERLDALAPGGRCGIMDGYLPNPGWRLRVFSLRYAADVTRPGFEPLQAVAADFKMEGFQTDSDAFYIASGTKR